MYSISTRSTMKMQYWNENNIQPSITKSFDFMESVSVDEINCN